MRNQNQLLELSSLKDVNKKTLNSLWEKGTVREYKKGSLVVRSRVPAEYVFLQLSGKSIIYNLTHDGNRKIIFIFGKGALLNDHIMNTHSSAVYCETIEKSRIFAIPVSDFTRLMEQDFSLVKAVLVLQEHKLWRTSHQLKNTMGSIYMERKLAAKLWKLSRDFGVNTELGREIDIQMPITFLADMLGASRETTSRLCSSLENYGLIKILKKRIIITDSAKIVHFYKTGK
ncbi:MAG: Crp/Fnr family transcriptional regulator [Blautia sp.]